MIFKQIESGGDRNYAYLIASEETMEAALVDPSPDPLKVINMVKKEGVEIKYIVNTHSHYDHSAGNDKFGGTEKGKSIIFINCGGDTVIKDGETLELGELILEFIHTPGHTEDSICIKVEDKLVTGDTLFVGKVGGTYGEEDSKIEFESLKKLMILPPATEVWPGHNYGETPSSTIGFELKNNPFIKRLGDFSNFLWLKQNWPEYKLEHGIK
jgi:glyoxylase-like metal-dependent hydrolase (beta-lactamase superfamily II)